MQLIDQYSAIHPPLRLPQRAILGLRADVSRHFRETAYSKKDDIATIKHMFKWFKGGFERQIGRINADPSLNKAQKAAARRAFYEEALHNTEEAAAALRFLWPRITPTERCLALSIAFFRKVYIHMRRHEFKVWVMAGGEGLRRRSI